jgi:hypothetical protein
MARRLTIPTPLPAPEHSPKQDAIDARKPVCSAHDVAGARRVRRAGRSLPYCAVNYVVPRAHRLAPAADHRPGQVAAGRALRQRRSHDDENHDRHLDCGALTTMLGA